MQKDLICQVYVKSNLECEFVKSLISLPAALDLEWGFSL